MNYSDESGHMPEWAMWVIGGVLLIGSIALTIATGGTAAGTISATVHTIATGAMISGLTSATIGTIASGLSYENGVVTWNWSGAAGSALSNVGSSLSTLGKLGKLEFACIQGFINSCIASTLTATQSLITGEFSWDGIALSAIFFCWWINWYYKMGRRI
mgnify:CR=1 FL=1